MTDKFDNIDINIAATLRDIAANCDKTTGRVLKLCNAAAADGKSSLIAKVSVEDHDYLLDRWFSIHSPGTWRGERYAKLTAPPLIQKLESLGFSLQYANGTDFCGNDCYIKVSW